MHQRIGVNALDGARERHRIGLAAATGLRGRQAYRRALAFAAREERVAHRYMDCGRFGLFRGENFSRAAFTNTVLAPRNLTRTKRPNKKKPKNKNITIMR